MEKWIQMPRSLGGVWFSPVGFSSCCKELPVTLQILSFRCHLKCLTYYDWPFSLLCLAFGPCQSQLYYRNGWKVSRPQKRHRDNVSWKSGRYSLPLRRVGLGTTSSETLLLSASTSWTRDWEDVQWHPPLKVRSPTNPGTLPSLMPTLEMLRRVFCLYSCATFLQRRKAVTVQLALVSMPL